MHRCAGLLAQVYLRRFIQAPAQPPEESVRYRTQLIHLKSSADSCHANAGLRHMITLSRARQYMIDTTALSAPLLRYGRLRLPLRTWLKWLSAASGLPPPTPMLGHRLQQRLQPPLRKARFPHRWRTSFRAGAPLHAAPPIMPVRAAAESGDEVMSEF